MLPPSESLELAKRLFPGIIQGFESLYDLPCPIHTGDFIPSVRPMVYFKADRTPNWDTCLYCLFWYKDTAAPHAYDFTGWLEAKGKGSGEPPVRIARHHWEYAFYGEDPTGSVVYSARDHNPIVEVKVAIENQVIYESVDFTNMEDPRFRKWADSDKSIFGDAVTPPWRWMDPVIKKAGLIWRDPAQFIELALKAHEKGHL